MSIYTKTGDAGSTSLGNGARVSKAHLRVEAYGTLDELCSHVGLLRAMNVAEPHRRTLLDVQQMLMTASAQVALCKGVALTDDGLKMLEQAVDALQQALPPLRRFVLPGGSMAAAQCHVARCVCRRAERAVVRLGESEGSCSADATLMATLNRLSDYLFVLARMLCYGEAAPKK